MPHLSFIPIDTPGLEERWTSLAAGAPQHSVFSTLTYARALSDASGYTCEAALASTEKGRDDAGVLLFSQKKGPFKRVLVPPFTPYTSFLTRQTPAGASDLSMFAGLIAQRYDDLRLHLHPSILDVRGFQWAGWDASPLYTYRIDISNVTTDFAGWSAGTRRTYRKNEPALTFDERPDAVREVIGLCLNSYRRQKRHFPLTPDRLTALVLALQRAGYVRVFTVSEEDAGITGGLVALIYNDEAFYWIAGSQPGPSMTVLIGRALLALQEAGVERFDFVGANTPSIAEFKRRFGAILTPYSAITRCPNKVLSVVKRLLQ